MQFSQSSGYFMLLRSKHFLHYTILERPQPIFSLSVRDQVSHPYKTTGKINVMYILIVICLCRQKEDKNPGPNGSRHCSNFNLFKIFQCMWFWFVSVILKYENFVTFSKQRLASILLLRESTVQRTVNG